MSGLARQLGQCINIPKPPLTEANLPDQSNKVFIVTGSNTGVGFELAKILYQANARVYIAGRSAEKCTAALERIQALYPASKGHLDTLKLDLADLTTIKSTVHQFLGKEKRLDVLWNNAGLMMPPRGSKTVQDHEIQMGTNCLGPFLLTKLLLPVLKETAANSPPNSVRVAWAGSLAIDSVAPSMGVKLTENGIPHVFNNPTQDYGQSKAGNLFLAWDFGKRNPDSGIVHVCFNPGNLRTELQRHVKSNRVIALAADMVGRVMLYPAKYGAYTELYCGLSNELTTADNGIYIAPWGRKSTVCASILEEMKADQEETKERVPVAKAFGDYCNEATKAYA